MDNVKALLEKGKIIWFFLLRYFCVIWAWCSKLVAIRIRKMKQVGTEKKMEKLFTEVGKNVFQLYQEGEQNLMESASIQQQLSEIQQLLGKKNTLEDKIREIEEQYKQKVVKAKEKYEKRKAGGAVVEPIAEENVAEPEAPSEESSKTTQE